MNSYKQEESVIKVIAQVIFALYMLSTQIMSIYFWWQMMKEDNFFMGIVIDPIIAEFKGILWPFIL